MKLWHKCLFVFFTLFFLLLLWINSTGDDEALKEFKHAWRKVVGQEFQCGPQIRQKR